MVSYQLAESRSTLLDSTRESILALRYNFWRLQGMQSCIGKPVLICNWLFRLFSRHISRTQSFQQNRHINFHALVALKLLVSLISRLVACSARIVVDRQTDKQTRRKVTLAAHARQGTCLSVLNSNFFVNPLSSDAYWPHNTL